MNAMPQPETNSNDEALAAQVFEKEIENNEDPASQVSPDPDEVEKPQLKS